MKHWFALSGPSGTGKTTLMHQAVACLREMSIEAVGVTERVRLMPNVTHVELSTNFSLHLQLFEAQMKIEKELDGREETQVIVLDRCLLDYVVLAIQSFPKVRFSAMQKELIEYLNRFDGIIIPSTLDMSPTGRKARPEDAFRHESERLFGKGQLVQYGLEESKIQRLDKDVPLRDRCKWAVDYILNTMGRTDVFRDYYRLSELAKAIRLVAKYLGTDIDRVWIYGSRSHQSATLPTYSSDYDFFVEMNVAEKSLRESYSTLREVSTMMTRMFGVNASITPVTAELAEMISMKELVD